MAQLSDKHGWQGDMTLRERLALALHDANKPDDTGYTLSERMMSVHGGPADSSYFDAADMILATGHFDVDPALAAPAPAAAVTPLANLRRCGHPKEWHGRHHDPLVECCSSCGKP